MLPVVLGESSPIPVAIWPCTIKLAKAFPNLAPCWPIQLPSLLSAHEFYTCGLGGVGLFRCCGQVYYMTILSNVNIFW